MERTRTKLLDFLHHLDFAFLGVCIKECTSDVLDWFWKHQTLSRAKCLWEYAGILNQSLNTVVSHFILSA